MIIYSAKQEPENLDASMKSCLSQSQFQNGEFKSLIKNHLLSEFLEDKNDSNVVVNVPKERSVLFSNHLLPGFLYKNGTLCISLIY